MSNKVLKFLTGLFLFTFPLERFGVNIGGYPLTLPFIAISIMALVLVLNSKLNKRQVIIAGSFVVWIVGSLIINGKFSGLLSAFVFSIMIIPSISLIPANLEQTAIKWLIRGSILSLILAAYDAFAAFTGAPTFGHISPLFLEQNIDTNIIFRLKSTFLEPSVYAIYLAFLIIILDYLPANYFTLWKRRILYLLYSIALIMTLSISGWILVAVYYIIKLFLQMYSVLFHRMRINPKSIMLNAVGILLICILVFGVSDALQLDIAGYANNRLFRTATMTTQGSLEHEGTRTNAFKVVWEYLSKADIDGIIVGEGFNNYENWLMSNYSRADKSTMIEGKISNIYAAVALGSGIVGLILYLLFVASFLPLRLKNIFNPNARYIICFMVVWIVAQFATGSLILYYIWGYAFLLNIIVNSIKTNPPSSRKQTKNMKVPKTKQPYLIR